MPRVIELEAAWLGFKLRSVCESLFLTIKSTQLNSRYWLPNKIYCIRVIFQLVLGEKSIYHVPQAYLIDQETEANRVWRKLACTAHWQQISALKFSAVFFYSLITFPLGLEADVELERKA